MRFKFEVSSGLATVGGSVAGASAIWWSLARPMTPRISPAGWAPPIIHEYGGRCPPRGTTGLLTGR